MAACLACIAPPPASRLPRKVYNALVADLFPAHAPALDAPLSLFVRRRIAKLADYVAANPNQLPKVSRRLARKVHRVLPSAREHGHAKTAVYAFALLLARTDDLEASFRCNFFAPELVGCASGDALPAGGAGARPVDPILPALLRAQHLGLRTLGAELLARFIALQTPADHRLAAVQRCIGPVRACVEAPSAPATEQLLAARLAELRGVALRCIQAFVAMCARLRATPTRPEALEAVALLALEGAPLPAVAAAAAAKAGISGVADVAFEADLGPRPGAGQQGEGGEDESPEAAVLRQLGALAGDAVSAHRIAAAFLSYMRTSRRWREPGAPARMLALLRSACGASRMALLAELARAAGEPGLAPGDRVAVVALVAEEGRQQELAYGVPVLSLALAALPAALAMQAADPEDEAVDGGELHVAVRRCVQELAAAVGDAGLVAEAVVAAAADLQPGHSSVPHAALCLDAALDAAAALTAGGAIAGAVVAGIRAALPLLSDACGPRAAAAQRAVTQLLAAAGGAVRDRALAPQLMLSLGRAVARPGATPEAVATMSAVGRALVANARAPVVVAAARVVAAALTGCLGGSSSAAGSSGLAAACAALEPVPRAAAALFADALCAALAEALPCPALVSLALGVSPGACPALSLDGAALAARPGHGFGACSPSAASAALADAGARAGGAAAWVDRFGAALSTVPALKQSRLQSQLAGPLGCESRGATPATSLRGGSSKGGGSGLLLPSASVSAAVSLRSAASKLSANGRVRPSSRRASASSDDSFGSALEAENVLLAV